MNKKGIIIALLSLLGFEFIPSIIMIIFKIFGINDILTLEFLAYILYIIILFIIFRKTMLHDIKSFKKENFKIMIKYYLIGITIMIVSNLIINFIIFDGEIASNESSVRELLATNAMLGLIMGGVFAPIVEELTFRRGFRDISNNKTIFVILSTLIFAFLHVTAGLFTDHGIELIQLVYLIPYGSVAYAFASIYAETDNIYSTIFTHAFHNTIMLILIFMA